MNLKQISLNIQNKLILNLIKFFDLFDLLIFNFIDKYFLILEFFLFSDKDSKKMKFFIFLLCVIASVISFQNCKILGNNKIQWNLNQTDNQLHLKITFSNTKGFGYVSVGFNSKGNTMGSHGNVVLGFSNQIYEYLMIGFMAPVLIQKNVFNETIVEIDSNIEMEFIRPLNLKNDQFFEIRNETSTLMFAFQNKNIPNGPNEIPQHTKTEKYELNWFDSESC